MEFSTTDGKIWRIPDMCGHCQMTTGGTHHPDCPLFQKPNYIYKVSFHLLDE